MFLDAFSTRKFEQRSALERPAVAVAVLAVQEIERAVLLLVPVRPMMITRFASLVFQRTLTGEQLKTSSVKSRNQFVLTLLIMAKLWHIFAPLTMKTV
jgi:hypothetical protein